MAGLTGEGLDGRSVDGEDDDGTTTESGFKLGALPLIGDGEGEGEDISTFRFITTTHVWIFVDVRLNDELCTR